MKVEEYRKTLKRSEHAEQAALFRWAKSMERRYPDLELLYAVPNAAKRTMATAGRMKAEGLKAGVPDVWLPVPRVLGSVQVQYHGLVIEMKVGKNKPTQAQERWLSRLRDQRYMTAICYSFEAARDVIMEYLGEAR